MRTIFQIIKPQGLCIALAATHMLACGSPATVMGSLKLGSRDQGISIGQVTGIAGTYEDGTCTDPATGSKRMGATWSIGTQLGQSNPPEVIQNDRSCLLDLTSIAVVDSAGLSQQATPDMPFVLPEFFLPEPVLFHYTDSGTGAVMHFYVNADVTPADFSTPFSIQVLYSDSLGPVTGLRVKHSYITSSLSEASNIHVLAPADTLDFSNVTVILDSNNRIASTGAEPTFQLGDPSGTMYTIAAGACPTTLADASLAYSSGTQVLVTTPPTAADFGLVLGADLSAPMERCMLVANCETLSNVCSFQMFDVVFE